MHSPIPGDSKGIKPFDSEDVCISRRFRFKVSGKQLEGKYDLNKPSFYHNDESSFQSEDEKGGGLDPIFYYLDKTKDRMKKFVACEKNLFLSKKRILENELRESKKTISKISEKLNSVERLYQTAQNDTVRQKRELLKALEKSREVQRRNVMLEKNIVKERKKDLEIQKLKKENSKLISEISEVKEREFEREEIARKSVEEKSRLEDLLKQKDVDLVEKEKRVRDLLEIEKNFVDFEKRTLREINSREKEVEYLKFELLKSRQSNSETTKNFEKEVGSLRSRLKKKLEEKVEYKKKNLELSSAKQQLTDMLATKREIEQTLSYENRKLRNEVSRLREDVVLNASSGKALKKQNCELLKKLQIMNENVEKERNKMIREFQAKIQEKNETIHKQYSGEVNSMKFGFTQKLENYQLKVYDLLCCIKTDMDEMVK